eukprot:CAMPEP_0179951806 /NCGR_PEP_ID=MMETSP0983-20121128/23883_1 /TAXON_ID=483367 /ORGANISM="non described non described, Strain CCMP 2436" /LENGTH=112 /DNA_ID=CAMNT_0021862273 /DNA_START=191 /DNA_END=529 /DNA_ORIENTATION=-
MPAGQSGEDTCVADDTDSVLSPFGEHCLERLHPVDRLEFLKQTALGGPPDLAQLRGAPPEGHVWPAPEQIGLFQTSIARREAALAAQRAQLDRRAGLVREGERGRLDGPAEG